MERQVHVPKVAKALAGSKMVVLLLVVVRLVLVISGDPVFLIFPARIVGAVRFQHIGGDAGPCLVGLFDAAECLEADQRVISVVSRRGKVGVHVGIGPVDVSVALDIGITGIEDEMVL